LPLDTKHSDGRDPLIEVQMSSQLYQEMGFKEGGKLMVLPKKARTFLES
jgi:hypothetical protein